MQNFIKSMWYEINKYRDIKVGMFIFDAMVIMVSIVLMMFFSLAYIFLMLLGLICAFVCTYIEAKNKDNMNQFHVGI